MERPPMERALSTDVVMDIVLSHLREDDLLACRKVSKFWNKAASSVLRKRSTTINEISDERDLMELQECIKQNSDFPFSGLTFDEPWRLCSVKAMEFFQNYGARFTRLHLGVDWDTKLQVLAPFIHHLPRLSILEMSPLGCGPPPTGLLNSSAGQEDRRILNLPLLRTLSTSVLLEDDLLRDVLAATSTSLRIQCLWSSCESLEALKRAGMLQAVSVLKVDADGDEDDYALRVDKLLSTELPKLTKLDFDAGAWISREGLMKLLISSQHTLKKLRLVGMCPSQFLSECPVLAKLTKLSLRIYDESYEYIFQGRQGHKFPALKAFKLVTKKDKYNPLGATKLSDGLFIVPSLKTIHLDGHFDKAGIEYLAQSFPNVIEIRLNGHVYDCGWPWENNQVDFGSFEAFKILEKLRVWHSTVEPSARNYMNMDSLLTGIPITICENLRKHRRQNLTDSAFNEILRDGPSILELKNLKELTVFVTPGHPVKELPEEPPFISMVSVWYALQMMPNLQVKFLYDYNALSWRFEKKKRDKAVKAMKAAFKHVQPYAELEPFYY